MEEKDKVEAISENEDAPIAAPATEQDVPKSEIAKVLAFMERKNGDPETPPEETPEEQPKSFWKRLGSWIANFWYHHKWKTVVTLFFVTVLAIIIPQFLTRENSDIQIMYGGPVRLKDTEIIAITDAFEQMMWADLDTNEDGKLESLLMYQTIMTDAQIEEAEKNGSIIVNRQELQDSKQLNMFLLTGEAIICLLDPTQYEEIKDASGFLPLDAIELTELAVSPYDDCGVRLKDTDFGKRFAEAFAPLPDDTILCIRRMTTLSFFQSEKAETARHQAHVDLFKSILTYSLTAN